MTQFNDWQPALYADICTFENLRPRKREAMEFIESIFEAFVKPNRLLPLNTYAICFNGKMLNFTYNIKNASKLADKIESEEIRHLLINHVLDIEDILQPELAIGITFDYAHGDHLYEGKTLANNMAFSLNQRIWNGVIPPEAQKTCKDIFIDTFQKANGAVGYIHLGLPHVTIAPNETRFEENLGLNFTGSSSQFATRVRGAFWGSMLSAKHIELFGGLESILQNAPCHCVEPVLCENGSQAVYLQLTDNIHSCTEEQLQSMHDFLRPLLPG